MDKIINYVKNGKGVGLLFILAASVIVTVVLLFTGKRFYNEMRPQIMLVAEDFLPITVENGRIVKPAETYKMVSLNFDDSKSEKNAMPIVLDTRETASQVPSGQKAGIYILKDKLYLVSPSKITMYALPDGVWDKAAFEEFLDYFSGIFSGILMIIGIAAFFLINLFKALLVSILGLIGVKVMKVNEKVFDFSALMRGSAVLVSVIAVAVFCLEFFANYNVPSINTILLAALLEWVFLYKEKPVEA